MRTRSLILAALVIACQREPSKPPPPAPVVETASAPASPPAPQMPLEITSPANGTTVCHQPIVRGRVRDPNAKVHVIVKAMAIGTCFVQPPVDVNQDGTWDTQIFVGHSEGEDNGKHFKLRAVANPRESLRRGQELSDWPEGELQSPVIEVVKRACPPS